MKKQIFKMAVMSLKLITVVGMLVAVFVSAVWSLSELTVSYCWY